ncbi:MAG: DNA repair protein RecO [Planctomycetes bacterium]|nr:DNA repair protein RecO [Planctomycetota bacterium]
MKLHGIVWKRSDFRESSRVVTLITREQGRIRALSKGAHRPNSAVLGKLDLFNRVEVTLSGRGMPILGRTVLIREPRRLREPRRFLVAQHLAELFDRTVLDGRADPEQFDLLDGGLTLVELAPLEQLATIVTGVEVRLLASLGVLSSLDHCAQCGRKIESSAHIEDGGGVFCGHHASPQSSRVRLETLRWLDRLVHTPGRQWTKLEPPSDQNSALGVLSRWMTAALEVRLAAREPALRACRGRAASV